MGVTTFPKKMFPETNGCTTFPNLMLLRAMIYNISKHNVAKTIGFTTFPKTMLLKPLVLQFFKQTVAKQIDC